MSERHLLFTIAVGEAYQRMAALTHPSLRRYADRIGADFLSVSSSDASSPHWEKCRIFDLLNDYDRILYLDTDMIVRDDCPDIFKLVPKMQLGGFNEAPFTGGRYQSMYDACRAYGIKVDTWNGKYYNTGVMVVSRPQKYLFRKPALEDCNFYEQGYLNLEIAKNDIAMFDLPYKFNRMTCMDGYTGEDRFASYIIHYAGYPSLEFVLSLIPGDIQRWESDSPDYEYQRHLFIDVQGGLGDQICAEPAIRYMAENVYPGADIVIATHFPRIFEHLDMPAFEHGKFVPGQDTPYRTLLSLPGPEKVMWSIVSNLLCNTVDYTAMALLRRTLPNKLKRIQLAVHPSDIENAKTATGVDDLSDIVLVHAGRHWESKTFPVEWWQEVVDGLSGRVPVCLIGWDDENRGTVPIDVPDGVIDTRYLLDMGALFGLISQAWGLVSNDSAPIHVAGAFDGYIVLIPTCKHPDHVLPYRDGGHQDWRSAALYRALTIQDKRSGPTEVHGSSGEFVEGDILDYLPLPGDVVAHVLEAYQDRGD